jgi:hypothetical protein
MDLFRRAVRPGGAGGDFDSDGAGSAYDIDDDGDGFTSIA